MRLLAHIVGWTLLIVALVIAIRDGLASLDQKVLVIKPLGQIWYDIDPPSLNTAQAVVERYVSPTLWDPAIVTILQLPGVAVFGVLGIVFLLLSRAGGRGRPLLSRKRRT